MFEKCNKIKWNKVCIPLIFSPILLFFDMFKNYIYIPVIMFISSFILFWNIPYIIFYTASKPLYYEDLFIDRNKIPILAIDINTKKAFKNFFTWFLIFTNSLLTTGLYNYWLFKTQGSNSFYEIIGITGGILKIFQMINHYSAVSALYFIRKSIRSKIYIDNNDDDNVEII